MWFTFNKINCNYLQNQKKNRACFVPLCKSGYRSTTERVSSFSVPKDEELFKKWQLSIGRTDRELTRRDTVCERHFLKSDISREWRSGDV